METTIDDPYPAGLLFILIDILASPVIYYLINGIILALLLFLSGLISGSETAYFSLSSEQITRFRKSPDVEERKLYELIRYQIGRAHV